MRILLFGRHGQAARTFHEEARRAHDVTALGREQADLLEEGAAERAVETHRPELVVNAAAYTAVDKAEDEKAAAMRLNVGAVAEMAAAAKAAGADFIHISTDYVFNGEKTGAYSENDPANPINVYGETKRKGEIAALDAHNQSVILRTSWVFSEYGANFVKTMLRLGRERSELDIVDDQLGGPTPARDIAKAILAIAGKKRRGAPGAGVYHFQGAPTVSWAAFAAAIFKTADLATRVNPIPTAQFPTPARRPLKTALDCARIERDFGVRQPDWRAALHQVVAALKEKELGS